MLKRIMQLAILLLGCCFGMVFANAHVFPERYSSHHQIVSTKALSSPTALPANDETVGTVQGKLGVAPTGAASYSIPISVPAGTAGMTPQLSISYDSQSQNGMLGMGFSLQGLTAITRAPSNLSQNGKLHGVDFTDEDRFAFNGQQLIATKGTYGQDQTEYHTYLDNQAKIISYGRSGNGPASFKVYTKGGQFAEYGVTDDSSLKADVKDPTGKLLDGQTVKVWALDKIKDTAGNYLSVHYTKTDDTGELYPAEIDYTANDKANLTPHSKVNFIYEDRTDVRKLYQVGSLTKAQKRLKEIKVSTLVNDQYQLVYDYKLNYEYSPNTYRSRITSIQKCNGNGVCFKPTTFQWQTNEEGWEKDDQYAPKPIIIDHRYRDFGVRFVDLNGNGLLDMVQNFDNQAPYTGAWINDGTTWVKDDNYTPKTAIVDNDRRDRGWRLVDLNGNGLLDIVQNANNNQKYYGAWINNGETWEREDDYKPPQKIVDGYRHDLGWRLIDLNGNGLLDIVQNYDDQKGYVDAWINDGSKWEEDSKYAPPNPIVDGGWEDLGWRLADLNSNGLTDILQNFRDTKGNEYIGAWLNTGGIWQKEEKLNPPRPFVSSHRKDAGTRLIDLTGNGLLDVSQNYHDDHKSVWLNTGNGWKHSLVVDLKFDFPEALVNSDNDDLGVRLVDLNGDGLLDVVRKFSSSSGGSSSAYINTPQGWKSDSAYLLDNSFCIVDHHFHDQGVRFIDLNGNGIMDVVQSLWENSDSSSRHVTSIYNKHAWLNKAKKLPDMLIGVTDALGEKTSIDYEPLSGTYVSVYSQEHNADGSLDSKYPNPQWDGAMYVVYQTASDTALNDPQTKAKYLAGNGQVKTFSQSPYSTIPSNADGSQHITTYHYTGARMNKLGVGFLGFHKVETTDNTTGIKTTVTYSQDPAQHNINQVLSTEVQQADGKILSTSANTWDLKTFGDGTVNKTYYMPFTKEEVKKTYSLSGNLLSTVTTDTTYDDYANPTELKVTTQDSTGNYIVDTKNSYNNEINNWFIGELTDTQVTRSAPSTPNITRTSHFDYDSTTGMLTKTVVEPNDANFTVTTESQRDQFGNVINTTISGNNFATRTTSQQYDAQGRFVISQTNAMGQTVTQEMDPRFGSPTQTTNLDGLITHYQYDGWGRLILTTNPDNTQVQTAYSWINSSVGNGMNETPMYAVYGVFTHATLSPISAVYDDQLSRPVAKSTQGVDGTLIWSNTFYDDIGRVIQQCQKHFDNDKIYSSRFEYDVLGRMIKTTNPDNTVIHVNYNGFTTTTINQLNQKTTKITNAIGKIIQAIDNAGNVINYQYDAYGNMTAMIDSANNISSIQYDRMGHKIGINDPDKGKWQYNYNVLGNLMSQTDALNHTTTMQYDLLGRLIARTDSGNTSSWTYGNDLAQHNVGKLIQVNGVSNANGNKPSALQLINAAKDGLVDYQRTIQYDDLGRASSTTVKLNGTDYTTAVSYYQDSKPDVTTYSNGVKIKNIFNEYGFLTDKKDATTGNFYWHLNSMDALGNVTSFTRSNGLVTTNIYDPATGFLTDIATKLTFPIQLQQRLFSGLTHYKETHHQIKSHVTNHKKLRSPFPPRKVAQSVHYIYDVLGNVEEEYDDTISQANRYTYDNLNRLTSWTERPNPQNYQLHKKPPVNYGNKETYQYDVLGNITYKSNVGHYHYGHNAGPHAVTSVTDDSGKEIGTFGYDADGNQTQATLNGQSRTISYTSYGKPLQINSGNAQVNFYYNADCERFMRVDKVDSKTDTTLYLGDEQIITHQNGTDIDTETKISVGGALIDIDETQGEKVYELLTDNLGSMTVITNQNGSVIQQFSYTPFGEQIQVRGTKIDPPISHEGFTGHEAIESMNLIHMNGRIYDPLLGRFLSADPQIQDPTNSQSLNRYSYCLNNPLAFTDPTGYGALSDLWHDMSHTIGEILSNQYVQMAIGIALSAFAMSNPALVGLFGKWLAGALMSSVYSGVTTFANTGDIGSAFKHAAINFATAAIWKGTGDFLGETPEAIAAGEEAGYLEKVAVHGLVGGGIQAAEGGSFQDGFLSAAVGEAVPINSINKDSHSFTAVAERTAAAAVVGGTVASATGGNFANGAKTAAFAQLFNSDSHPILDAIDTAIENLDDIGNALMPFEGIGVFPKLGAAGLKEAKVGIEEVSKVLPVVENDLKIGGKILKQMVKRGWSKPEMLKTINNPVKTAATTDTRWIGNGLRNNEAATAYFSENGHYIVKNDVTNDIVQISNRFKPDWKSPF